MEPQGYGLKVSSLSSHFSQGGEQGLDGRRGVDPGKGLIEAVRPFENRFRSREAGAGEERCGHARVAGPTGMETFRPGSVGEVLDDAPRLAAADTEGVDELILAETVEPTRHRGGGEARGERGGMIVARVEAAGHGEADPAHDFHARDGCLERGLSRGAHRLPDGKRGGDGEAAGVHDGVLARVVEVEAVSERGVGQHGAGRSHPGLCAHQCALRLSTEALGRLQDGAAELLPRRREAAPQRVEHQQARPLDHRRRDIGKRQIEREAGIAPGNRGTHVCSPVRIEARNA